LNTEENSPSREEINDSWTFMNRWNPEAEIKGLLPCAFLPTPGYRAKKVDVNQNISWLSGKDVVKHLVYFGTNENPDFKTATTDTTYEPGILEGTSIYYWRIDEVTSENDTVKGQLWRFSTQVDSLPK
jgi:hypothetical protein